MRTNTGQILYIPKIGQRANLQHPLMKGCVGWWPLNDGAGTKAKDISGNGNDGTQSGGVSWVSTEKGTVASFDGTDDRINVSGITTDFDSSDFSVSMWVNLHRSSNYQYFWSRTGDSEFDYLFWISNDGFLRYFSATSLTTQADWTLASYNVVSSLVDQWSHFTVCVSGNKLLSSSISVYKNGSLLTPYSQNDSSGGTLRTGSGDFSIAGRASGSRYIEADIQNVRVYDRALSATEILELYTNPWAGLSIPSETRYFFVPQLITASPKLFNIKGSSISMTSNTGRVSVRAAR